MDGWIIILLVTCLQRRLDSDGLPEKQLCSSRLSLSIVSDALNTNNMKTYNSKDLKDKQEVKVI